MYQLPMFPLLCVESSVQYRQGSILQLNNTKLKSVHIAGGSEPWITLLAEALSLQEGYRIG